MQAGRGFAASILALVLGLSLSLSLGACGPDLGGLEKGEDGRVAAAFNGDSLELDTGLRVFVTEIDAPRGQAPYARQAQAELDALVLHREVRLAYGGTKRWVPSRLPEGQAPSETAIAHVFVKSEGGRWFWLQHEMVARGAAYVRTRGDNHARAEELLALESQARAAGNGLWGERAYRVLSAAQAAGEAADLTERCQSRDAPYRFVEGVVAGIEESGGRAALRLSGDEEFTLVVFGRAHRDWRGPAFHTYEGKRVRARGALETFRRRNAPADAPGRAQMCVDDAGALELIERG
jgi:endonuclease YncB( thermonuclease family)